MPQPSGGHQPKCCGQHFRAGILTSPEQQSVFRNQAHSQITAGFYRIVRLKWKGLVRVCEVKIVLGFGAAAEKRF